MANETDAPCRRSEIVSLREHFERLLDESEKRALMRYEAQERALKIAEEHAAHWRASANEWRAAMTDRDRNFLPRSMGVVIGIVAVLGFMLQIYRLLKGG